MTVLLNHGAKINATDIHGNTILHHACENNVTETALLLLEKGAELDVENKEEKKPADLADKGLRVLLERASQG